MSTAPSVSYSSRQGRGIVAATTLGSGMAMLDGTVVNVALRTIGNDFDASLAELQWISNGYLLSLSSLILLGGALGDRYGRRRVFLLGIVGFTVASALCGLATSPGALIAARIGQGVGSALLTPGSLAIIQSSFAPADRARAIGAWSGLGSVAAAIGPFVGGALIEYASWRWVFWVNIPLAALTALLARRVVPETRDDAATGRLDVLGATLAGLALAAVTYLLVDPRATLAVPAGVVASLAAVGFLIRQRRARNPLMPLSLFGSVQFSAANAMTLLTYGALGGVLFFLTLQLQTTLHYGPLPAGLASLPVTVAMIALAARFGALASRIGPRWPMAIGPLVCGLGTATLSLVGPGDRYLADVLPGITIFGLGLATLVAPLTATVLAAAPQRRAGIASGINNAVARTGSLLAVAALPVAVGLTGDDYTRPAAMTAGYQRALIACAVLLVCGGVISALLIRTEPPASQFLPPTTDSTDPAVAGQ